ncbi:UspA domain-containing protein [Desulfosarcina cetonica]|nr:UspA domain-containing protein [Desulfosarcina cetonica]
MYRKILVPLDGSLRAETILPHVESLALRFDAEVVLLYVDAGSDLMLERDEVADVDSFLDRRRELIKKYHLYLQAIADKWHSAGITAEVRIARGAVVAGIINTAKQTSADLVAMASHGEGGEERTFYGSVAASVLNRIDRPLLLIRSRFLKPRAS